MDMQFGWREKRYRIRGWTKEEMQWWMDLRQNERMKINLHKHFLSFNLLVLAVLPATSMNFIHNMYVIRYEYLRAAR
jgi:hypothetical protein